MDTEKKENFSQLIKAAIDLYQANEFDTALDLVEKAEKINPKDPASSMMRGYVQKAQGQTDAAEINFERAVELDPKDADTLTALGGFYIGQKEWDKAIPVLKKRMDLLPADPKLLESLILMIRASNLPDKNEEIGAVLKSTWELSKDIEVGILYGRHLLLSNGELDEGKSVLQEVVEKKRTAKTLVELALALDLKGEYNNAIQLLREAALLDPNFDRAWRGLAQCFVETGEYQEGLRHAEKALALDPENLRNWIAKADALIGLEEFSQAAQAARQGLNSQSDTEEDEYTLSLIEALYWREVYALLRQDKIGKALQTANETWNKYDISSRFFTSVAGELINMEAWEKANEVLIAAQENYIGGFSLAAMHFQVFHMLNQPEKAGDLIKGELSQDAEKKLGLLNHIAGNMYLKSHEEPALNALKQLHEFSPENPEIANALAYVLIGKGELEEAEELLEKVVTNQPITTNIGCLARANLAFLFLVTDRIRNARELAGEILIPEAASDFEAFLRDPLEEGGQKKDVNQGLLGESINLKEYAQIILSKKEK